MPARAREHMPKPYLDLEGARLTGLVTEWLRYEATRIPFEVAATEAEERISIAGLDLQLRLDRIDRLADESLLVIDYKTGDVSPKLWELPRPDDVQLTLYAGFALDRMTEQLGGLVFAKVRTGDSAGFAGRVRTAVSTLKSNLHRSTGLVQNPLTSDDLAAWRAYIDQMARDFLAGSANVNPRDYPKTCERCGLQAICRIQENQPQTDAGRTMRTRRWPMPDKRPGTPPPDRAERECALDASRSVLVRAPAGSGKTDLLTRRFLKLLGEVEDPGQIVAITFTKAAAAEMRNRILSELEKAAAPSDPASDVFSMQALATRALERSQALGWNLIDLPAQLRISTIDAFCRDLALQQPLLSGLGGDLEINERPTELYRRAARRTLEQIGGNDAALGDAVRALLLWRDNSWQEVETQLVEMLAQRDRWMHDFVLDREPDWEALRELLEAPFVRATQRTLAVLCRLFDGVTGGCDEAHELARFACQQSGGEKSPWELAEHTEIPGSPFADGLDSAREAVAALAKFLQTQSGTWRSEKGLNTACGFPSKESKTRKARILNR